MFRMGLKDVRDLEQAANNMAIKLKQRLDLPANNFIARVRQGLTC